VPALSRGVTTTGRWVDDRLDYYDYKPDTVRREPNRDAYVVAEAFIYDANSVQRVAIRVMVSGQELHLQGMTLADAIHRGEAIRDQAVAKQRTHLPTGHRAVLYDLHGREIERVDAAQ
jgi:hypothetical protein